MSTRTDALAIVAKGRSAAAVRAALEALPEADSEVREAILARYQRVSASPRRLDADCSIRTALLRGLRSCVLPADRALLEDATRRYEHSYGGEVAANLRAAAVLTLSEIDTTAAGFHAVRLLREPATNSGEPRLSAARLLAVLGQSLPLYAHLLVGGVGGAEAAECFRGIADAPDLVLVDLIERWSDSADEVGLLGLLDALLETLPDRSDPRPIEAALLAFLRESPHLDLVRYLATAIVAGRRETLIAALREGPWPVAARREIVEEALSLLSGR